MTEKLGIFFTKIKKKSNLKYIVFTFLKYVEYAITASLFLFLAKMVGPEEYGKATSSFLAISYSSFAILGANQVLIKWYATHDEKNLKRFLVQYNFLYNVILSALVFVAIYFFLSSEYVLFAAGIAGLKLLQESIININRAQQKIYQINAIYLSFAICFLVLFFLFVEDVYSFFNFWLISISISATFGIILTFIKSDIWSYFTGFKKNLSVYWKPLISDGIKLAMIGAILPLFLNLDRILIINFTDLDKATLGNMQLADNIATVISFGVSSLFFITTPVFIKKLKKGEIGVKALYSISYKILLGLILLVLIAMFPITYLVDFFFQEYSKISLPLGLYLIGRVLYLGLFVPNILSVTFSKETNYIAVSYLWFLILLSAFTITIKFANQTYLIWLLPSIVVSVLIGMHIHFYLMYQGKDTNYWSKS